jgi:hypothetical protein
VTVARAEITHRYDDGTTVTAAVETANDYPDAVSDLIARVLELYRQILPDSE